MKEILFSEYDPKWPLQFNEERKRILDVLAENAFCIHHIGSTAVPGLAAKPRIDIIAEVVDIKRTLRQLPLAGYEYRGEWNIPGKYGFIKRGVVDVNLHVFPKHHAETIGNLMFRDYLRENSEVKESYENIKRQLALDPNMMIRNQEALGLPQYTIEKSDFVERILDQLGFDVPRLLQPTTGKQMAYLAQKGVSASHAILCLKGVRICGYAVVADHIEIYLDSDSDEKNTFHQLITHSVKNQSEVG
jgi:GrpB-like predicted nucleotidyltransferase (UPF0157 family)